MITHWMMLTLSLHTGWCCYYKLDDTATSTTHFYDVTTTTGWCYHYHYTLNYAFTTTTHWIMLLLLLHTEWCCHYHYTLENTITITTQWMMMSLSLHTEWCCHYHYTLDDCPYHNIIKERIETGLLQIINVKNENMIASSVHSTFHKMYDQIVLIKLWLL